MHLRTNADGCTCAALEVRGCTIVSENCNGFEYEPSAGEDVPDVFSVYWRVWNGEAEWICDCVTAQDARMVARELAHFSGLPVFDFIPE